MKERGKIGLVDTLGNVSYSLGTGALLDTAAGLDLPGVIASRTTATAMNSVTGGPYGFWREKMYKWTNTNKDSSKLRKTLTDLLAFNTFQVPIYAIAVAAGSLASDGEIDYEKVANGARNLALISPLIGPTMGMWMDFLRKRFNVKSAAEGAYEK